MWQRTGYNPDRVPATGAHLRGTHLASVIAMDSACHNTEATW
jgi:hypothetical protein